MESGGIIQRIRALVPVLIPLFVSAFRRAFDLATAMESRCYHGGRRPHQDEAAPLWPGGLAGAAPQRGGLGGVYRPQSPGACRGPGRVRWPMERNFLIKLAYDGAAYHGWQIQENALTVQQVFQEALGKSHRPLRGHQGLLPHGHRRTRPAVLCQPEDREPHRPRAAAGGFEPLPAPGRGGALGGAGAPGFPRPLFLQGQGVRLPNLEPPGAGPLLKGQGPPLLVPHRRGDCWTGRRGTTVGRHDFSSFCTLDKRERGDLTRTVTKAQVRAPRGPGHLHRGGGWVPVQHGAHHGGDAAAGAAGEVFPRGHPRHPGSPG